jgi:hypothetical protein
VYFFAIICSVCNLQIVFAIWSFSEKFGELPLRNWPLVASVALLLLGFACWQSGLLYLSNERQKWFSFQNLFVG